MCLLDLGGSTELFRPFRTQDSKRIKQNHTWGSEKKGDSRMQRACIGERVALQEQIECVGNVRLGHDAVEHRFGVACALQG